jgi:hypothetical protein
VPAANANAPCPTTIVAPWLRACRNPTLLGYMPQRLNRHEARHPRRISAITLKTGQEMKMSKANFHPDDIAVWADGTWATLEDIRRGYYNDKSDDYEILDADSPKAKQITGDPES